MKKEKPSISPLVLSHQPIKFETAHSWNKGRGNKNPKGDGDHGNHYPNEPRPGKPGPGPFPDKPWKNK